MSKLVENQGDIFKSYDITKNTTRNVMTKYEKTIVIGMRLEQLARGAPTLVDETNCKSLRDVVMKEIDERVLPFIVVRPLPSGKKEYWRIKDLIIIP